MTLSFRNMKSPLVAAIIWMFVASYFFDAANLDDLLPGNIVVHPDTDQASLAPTALSFDVLINAIAKSGSRSAAGTQCSKPRVSRIIIDQDSPSLAAEPLVAITTSLVFSEERAVSVQSHQSALSLYLLNRTLLL